MVQKAEKMLLEIIDEWLGNVQLFPKVWILKISLKTFWISGSVSGLRLKAAFGYSYPVANSHYPCGYPTGKPDSDNLCKVVTSTSVEHDPVPGSRSNRILQFRTWAGLDWILKKKQKRKAQTSLPARYLVAERSSVSSVFIGRGCLRSNAQNRHPFHHLPNSSHRHQRWADCHILRSRSGFNFLKISPNATTVQEVFQM